MSTQTPLINPDQTSGMLPQCCHSAKGGQEQTLALCNSPLSNQSGGRCGTSPAPGTFIVALCSRLVLLQHLKV